MKNKILEEIKKINFYSNYRPDKTLTENQILLVETNPKKLIDNLLTKMGAKNFSPIVVKNVDDMVTSFKAKFGDDVMDNLIAKTSASEADDIVKKLYLGEAIDNPRHASKLIEATADLVIEGRTVRELFAEAFEGAPIKQTWDALDDVGKVKFKDGHPSFLHFSDEFLDAAFGFNIKATRKAMKEAEEAAKQAEKKAADDAADLADKTAKEAAEKARLLNRNKLQKWADEFKEWAKSTWTIKGTLRKGINFSMDTFVLTQGLGIVFMFFGGPIWTVFASGLLWVTMTTLKLFLGLKFKIFKNFGKEVGALKKKVGDIAGDYVPAKKGNRTFREYMQSYIYARKGMGRAKSVYLSKGFWYMLTLWGILGQFLSGKFAALFEQFFGISGLEDDLSGVAALMKGKNWADTIMMASLTGDLYQDLYDSEPKGDLAEFGIEFDDTVLNDSAQALIDTLMIWKRYVGLDLKLVDLRYEPKFYQGYWIDSADVKAAEKSILEFFTNSPSLLFISAVSDRIKTLTKGSDEGEQNLMELIDDYKASKDQYLLDVIDYKMGNLTKDDLQFQLDFAKVKTKLTGKPLLTEEMDDFIIDMFDSVLKGEPLGQMKDLVTANELDCQQKHEMLAQTLQPTVQTINATFRELGYEDATTMDFDCTEDTLSFTLSRELDRAKIFKKLAKTLPFEGALYTNNEGLISGKNAKDVNYAWIELVGDFELIDLVGSQMGLDDESIETSSTKGMMYYALPNKKGQWCSALIEYFRENFGVTAEDDMFVGGACTTKIFKQMPVLKTIAAAQLAGFGDKIRWSDLENTFMQELQTVKPEDNPQEIDTDMMNIDESHRHIIGLGRVLIENRNTNGRTR